MQTSVQLSILHVDYTTLKIMQKSYLALKLIFFSGLSNFAKHIPFYSQAVKYQYLQKPITLRIEKGPKWSYLKR